MVTSTETVTVEAMAALGFETFAVAGHDRGGRVAYRMALDHPGRVEHLAVLDAAFPPPRRRQPLDML